jgi:hypothetical protein
MRTPRRSCDSYLGRRHWAIAWASGSRGCSGRINGRSTSAVGWLQSRSSRGHRSSSSGPRASGNRRAMRNASRWSPCCSRASSYSLIPRALATEGLPPCVETRAASLQMGSARTAGEVNAPTARTGQPADPRQSRRLCMGSIARNDPQSRCLDPVARPFRDHRSGVTRRRRGSLLRPRRGSSPIAGCSPFGHGIRQMLWGPGAIRWERSPIPWRPSRSRRLRRHLRQAILVRRFVIIPIIRRDTLNKPCRRLRLLLFPFLI